MIFRTEHLKVMPVDISGFLSSHKYIIDNINNSGYLSFFAIVSSPSTTTFTDVLFSAFVFKTGSSIETWTGITSLGKNGTVE